MTIRTFQRRLRYGFWLIRAYLEKHGAVFAAASLLGLLFVVLVIYFVRPWVSSFRKPSRRLGLVGNYTAANIPRTIQRKISLGLTDIDAELKPAPAGADSWEASESGKFFVFKLKNNLYWHDGKKFTARDINYNLKDVRMAVIDDFMIKFQLNDFYSPLPSIVSQPLFKNGLVGLGEYRLLKESFDNRFLKQLVLANHDQILTYKFYPTYEMAVSAFKLKEIDELQDIADIKPFSDWKNWVEIESTNDFSKYLALFFNLKNPHLENKALRQALTYALDDKKLSGGSTPAFGPIPPNSWSYNNNLKIYAYDLATAKKALERSGVNVFELNLTLSFDDFYRKEAEIIKSSWEELGVKTHLVSENDYGRKADASLLVVDTPADPDQYAFWHSTQEATNISGFKNARVDKLLEDARRTYDAEKRKEKYLEFQKTLVEEAPAAFLFYPPSFTIRRK